MTAETVAACLVVLISSGAALTDARSGRIPNALTLPGMFISPFAFAIFGAEGAWLRSLFGALVCGLPPFLLYRATKAQGIGGGDVKLFAAIGALLGPSAGLEIQLFSFVAVLVVAFAELAYRGRLFKTLLNALFLVLNRVLPKRHRRNIAPELLSEMRMGIPIWLAAVGALAVEHPDWWLR